MNSGFSYDPSMGVLNSIDTSALVTEPNQTALWALFVSQGGSLYRAPVTSPAESPQAASATGLLPGSFASVNLATGVMSPGVPYFFAAFTSMTWPSPRIRSPSHPPYCCPSAVWWLRSRHAVARQEAR